MTSDIHTRGWGSDRPDDGRDSPPAYCIECSAAAQQWVAWPCTATTERNRMATDRAVEAIRRAVNDPGPQPEHHRKVMERHRAEWPTLWRAIDALLADPA